jgi:signal transduction histidine kinase
MVGPLRGTMKWVRLDLDTMPVIVLDIGLVIAATLGIVEHQVVFWFHAIFVLLAVAALVLEFKAFAIRLAIWVPVQLFLIGVAHANWNLPSQEFIEIPLLTLVLIFVFLSAQARNRTLHSLKAAQQELQERARIEREVLERQLEHAQQLEAVGRATTAIAHDFNPVLTAVLGYTDELADALHGREAARLADEIANAVDRGASLVQDLVTFMRRRPGIEETSNVSELVRSLDHLLHRLVARNVELTFDLTDDAVAVKVGSSRLVQILLNLVVNASDAMPDGGRLAIRVHTLMRCGADRDGTANPVREVEIVVSDTGHGMDPATLARIFDSDFTTKDASHAGLGLATVRRIVEESGGTIAVETTAARGSTFRLSFPETVSAVPHLALVASSNAEHRSTATHELERAGYRVLVAEDGLEALDLVAFVAAPVDLAVIDTDLPSTGGAQLLRTLRKDHSVAAVLVGSGATGATDIDGDITVTSRLPLIDALNACVDRLQSRTLLAG